MTYDNGMIDKFVVVRCKNAGVHAGILVSHQDCQCVLKNSRRLWYWKPADNAAYLSGVAIFGLHPDSQIGEPIDVHLTEICEIILCTMFAQRSIQNLPSHRPGS